VWSGDSKGVTEGCGGKERKGVVGIAMDVSVGTATVLTGRAAQPVRTVLQ
jgi:hypothetical protein